MKTSFMRRTIHSVACLVALSSAPFAANAQLAIQAPRHVLGTGSNATPFLILEAENYISDADGDNTIGFIKVYNDELNTNSLGNFVLATNTTASKKGALFTKSPAFGLHADKVTYQVQFSTPGTYYLYMRFTMFDNNFGNGNYLSEDSFFVPPDFNKDPQTDWPLTDPANGRNGGYTEGCCGSSGFLFIIDYHGDGSRTAQTSDTSYWEGIFHWNQLLSSQFLTPGVSGEPNTPHKYVVTPSMVGTQLNFTVSYREGGVTPDVWLFSTHTNLLNDYTQAELDQLILRPKLTISLAGTNVLVSWPTDTGFVLDSTSSLSPASWTPVQTPAALVGSRNILTVPATGGNQYYRLRQP